MTVISVTLEGHPIRGVPLKFESVAEAIDSVLVSNYDPVFTKYEQLVDYYTYDQMYKFLSRFDKSLVWDFVKPENLSPRPSQMIPATSDIARALWRACVDRALPPPTEPVEIQKFLQDYAEYEFEQENLRRSTTTKSKETTDMADKAARKRIPNSAIISMGTDDDGNEYGADNNPIRSNTKIHDLFAQYKNGMTVGEARELEADFNGKTVKLETPDIKYHISRGWISVELVEEDQAEAA